MTSKHLDPLLDISQELFKVADVDAVADADAMRGPPTEPPGGGGGGGGGGGKPPDSPGGGGGGGGKPDGAGSKKGDLYGDQWVLLRDLDPTDGDGEGNGDPVLDTNGNPILVGWDGSEEFPIFLTDDDGDGKYEVPADELDYVQEVELERANVARAPDKVMDKALDAALGKIEEAGEVTTDAAGRIVCDGDTIDSPLENLALYQHFMRLGSTGDEAGSWGQDLIDLWSEKIAALVGDDPQNPYWDPSCLLGAAFSKETPISFDAVLYENTVLGVNVVQDDGSVDYFDFNDGAVETYDYDREARYEDVKFSYYWETSPGIKEQLTGSVYHVVFSDTDDKSLPDLLVGQNWVDEYLVLDDEGTKFKSEPEPATLSGANDFAQAADDAREVIEFLHTYDGELLIG